MQQNSSLARSDIGPNPAGPPQALYRAQPVGDPVLDAAARCVQRKGFDSTCLEEVAAEAGVSRTTLYRRFGSRENLFKALLHERSKPFRAWSQQILIGPGLPEERLETVLAHAILEMQRVGWLDHTIGPGISAASSRLIKASHAEGASDSLAPFIAMLIGRSPRPSEYTVADLLEWIAEQMIALASSRTWDEDALRKRLRYFVLPVLVPGAADTTPIATRLAAIEDKIDRLVDGHRQPQA